MKKFWGIAAFAMVQAAAAPKWELNDVSYLFPLPTTTGPSPLFQKETLGRFGELLPQILIDEADTSIKPIAPSSNLSAVALRVDPCFRSLPMDPCRKQVRLVWQPVWGAPQSTTFDAAAHTFYDIPDDDFAGLLKEIQRLKARSRHSTARLPLGIHPILQREGLHGPFMRDFRKAVLAVIGAKRLSRVTFMQEASQGTRWQFGGVDIGPAGRTPIQIARTHTEVQAFRNAGVPDGLAMEPEPKGPDTLDLGPTRNIPHRRSDAFRVEGLVRTTHRLDNPQLFTVDQMDCVSCHVSEMMRGWAKEKFPGPIRDDDRHRYKSEFLLSNTSPLKRQTNVLRAFGYFESSPAISQRTINESAEVAALLNRQADRPAK